jgi:hypothetical protein
MPTTALDAVLGNASFPRVHGSSRFSTLFVWLPVIWRTQPTSIDRLGTLFLTNGELTITLYPTRPPTHEATPHLLPDRQTSSEPFGTRSPGLSPRTSRPSRARHGRTREGASLPGDVPVRDSSPAFFEQAFCLKRELSSMKADLWQLKGILESLARGRVPFAGLESRQLPPLESLADEVSYIYETVENMREGILALLDLHMNVVSFDVNRFMRFLAVVSVLGLIPAVIGGLLGMNVADNPFQVTLSEVAFGVSMGMLFCLWLFLIKGWLR